MRSIRNTLLLSLLLLLPGIAPAERSDYRTRDEVASEARSRVDGRILSIKLRDEPPNPPEYRVKMLKNGDVHLLRLPARRKGDRRARPRR